MQCAQSYRLDPVIGFLLPRTSYDCREDLISGTSEAFWWLQSGVTIARVWCMRQTTHDNLAHETDGSQGVDSQGYVVIAGGKLDQGGKKLGPSRVWHLDCGDGRDTLSSSGASIVL